jgi:hypothetical protein
LLGVAVAGSIAVAVGIIFEFPETPSRKQRIATRLVIIGVTVEAIFTVLLFIFDEGISTAQQSKIISLETQIAPRTLDKSQFDAIASLKGKVKAINIMPEAALEPGFFADMIANALQSADVDVKFILGSSGLGDDWYNHIISGWFGQYKGYRKRTNLQGVQGCRA